MRKLDFTSAELWANINAVDERRETAYKAVLIVSLCATLSAWVAIGSVFPLLYTFINLSNNQIGHVLEFCEETATSVVHDSRELFELYANHAAEHRELQLATNATGNDVHDIFKRESSRKDKGCPCAALPGPPGEPGRSGLKGTSGTPGAKGNPAVLPCQPSPDYKKWCTTPCPQGPQGPAGSRGSLGDKGPKGDSGKNGVNGIDGKRGPQGLRGKTGTPGFDGEDGEPGRDRVPEPFTPGPAGPVGDAGSQGPIGPRGMPGIEGPQGPQGTRGDSGRNGVPGQRGSPGLDGAVGAPGDDGEKGVCPTLCASDGGVFFIDPPEWFFKDEDKHRKRR